MEPYAEYGTHKKCLYRSKDGCFRYYTNEPIPYLYSTECLLFEKTVSRGCYVVGHLYRPWDTSRFCVGIFQGQRTKENKHATA